jgi:hypothetical protein
VYRLTGNSSTAFFRMLETIFVPSNQMLFFNDYELTRRQVWHDWLGKWALPLIAPKYGMSDFIAAMNGTSTDSNYMAWFAARRVRQYGWNGAPSFLINGWSDMHTNQNFQNFNYDQWAEWIEANIRD